WTLRTVHKSRSHVAEDQRVIILPGLVTHDRRIGAGGRSEPVLSNIGRAGLSAKEESLNSNNVNCIDSIVAIHVGGCQPASRKEGNLQEMPLGSDHIHCVDSRAAAA